MKGYDEIKNHRQVDLNGDLVLTDAEVKTNLIICLNDLDQDQIRLITVIVGEIQYFAFGKYQGIGL